MIHAESDNSKQLVTVTFSGRVTGEEMHEHVRDIRALVQEMQMGFRFLTDLTNLESMATDCAPYIQQIMDLANAKGVKEVIRVVPDPKKDIGLNVMSQFHYDEDVRVATFETLDEALQSLVD